MTENVRYHVDTYCGHKFEGWRNTIYVGLIWWSCVENVDSLKERSLRALENQELRVAPLSATRISEGIPARRDACSPDPLTFFVLVSSFFHFKLIV